MNFDIAFGAFVFVVCLSGFAHWRYAYRADAIARHTSGWDLLRKRQSDPALERARIVDLTALAAVCLVFVALTKFSLGVPEPPGIVFAPIVGALAALTVATVTWLVGRARDIQ